MGLSNATSSSSLNTVTNCFNFGREVINTSKTAISSSAPASTGGIIGVIIGYANITQCGTVNETGIVSSQMVSGGILGYGEGNIEISSCFNTYGVQSEDSDASNSIAGGIVGNFSGTNISSCISDATIKGVNYVGGIVGNVSGTSVNIKECASYGMINVGDVSKAAGIVGNITGVTNMTNCSFVGSSNLEIAMFYNGEATCNGCYSQINDRKFYQGASFASYSLIDGMNNNMPMQNVLYHVENPTNDSTVILNYLKDMDFEEIK